MGTDITSMSHVSFEHIKGTKNILADQISGLRCSRLCDTLDPEEGKRVWTLNVQRIATHFNGKRRSKVTVSQIQHMPIY